MWNVLKFRIERWIQRGAAHQLLLIAGLIALVAMTAGGLALLVSSVFASFSEASWWAFLRLTDPGYLGDDQGLVLRTVSTAVTVVGYVLFMGSLIAIMTNWLTTTVRTLEAGLTPIALEGHLVVLGWTNRTPEVVNEIVHAEGRVKRFLQRSGVRSLRIVILAQELSPVLRLELKAQLGPRWNENQIIFRSGSSLRFEHLERVNALDAALLVIPGANFVLGGAAATDARVVKTIMSLVSYGQTNRRTAFPPIVAEVFDAQTAAVTRNLYPGQIELIASDRLISRLMVQNVRHEGLSYIYTELLSHTYGNEVYVRTIPEFGGASWAEIESRFTRAIPIGVARPEARGYRPHLNPPGGFRLDREDRIVFVAGSFEDTALDPAGASPAATPASRTALRADSGPEEPRQLRVLVLGWGHKVRSLLEEFSSHTGDRFDIDLLSLVPARERESALASCAIDPERVRVRQVEGDYALAADLRRLDLAGYDNIMVLGSDWLESDVASDARAILGYVQLRSLLPEPEASPKILVELLDPENERLFVQQIGEVIVSPLLLSHMLAHVALRPELGAVLDELFGPSLTEVVFRPAGTYGMAGSQVAIGEARRRTAQFGEIALGFHLHPDSGAPGLKLNPPPDVRWQLTDRDEIVVLTTNPPAEPPVGTAGPVGPEPT